MKDTLGVLLAGGAGERLYPLTRDRAKPAVTFGGIYRIIDITLSNCINSDLRRVYILTQYKALSLNRHIREGWNIMGSEMGEFIEVLPPMKRVSEQWYQGTADAVYQNIYSIGSEQPKHVLILSGDHIYKMNYGLMLEQHNETGADVTLATIRSIPARWRRFGVVEVDRDHRVMGFQEKPKETELRSPSNPEKVCASMGIYLFNTDVLIPVLLKDAEDPPSSHDFGKDILPKMAGRLPRLRLQLRRREQEGGALLARRGNARGLLRSQHGHRVGVAGVQPVRLGLADAHSPAPVSAGEVCLRRSWPHRHGGRFDRVRGLHRFRRHGERQRALARRARQLLQRSGYQHPFSHVNVGRHCRIRKAIIDRDVHIPEGTTIGYDSRG